VLILKREGKINVLMRQCADVLIKKGNFTLCTPASGREKKKKNIWRFKK
jgi:hypothetical protein